MKKYFEFNDHDYYALVVVESANDTPIRPYVIDAAKVYVEQVAGCSIADVISQGRPELVSREYAFWKFANAFNEKTVNAVIEEFEMTKNAVLLIDSALI